MNSASSLGPQVLTKKPNRYPWVVGGIILLFVVAVAGAYARFSMQRSCDLNAVKDASARLLRQRQSYDHTYQFATSVAQNAVVRPVADLQQILMDTQEVDVPACLQTAKEELIRYMDIVIRAFLAYGAQEPDSAVRDLLDQSNIHYQSFKAELEAVNQCAPFCMPW